MAEQTEWSLIEAKLQRQKKGDLIALVQDMYRYSSANQQFLLARYLNTDATARRGYKRYRQQLLRLAQDFEISQAHQVVEAYRQASGDTDGGIDLLITLLESSFQLAKRVGLHGGAFEDEIAEVVIDLCQSLSASKVDQPHVTKRLIKLFEQAPLDIHEDITNMLFDLLPEDYAANKWHHEPDDEP